MSKSPQGLDGFVRAGEWTPCDAVQRNSALGINRNQENVTETKHVELRFASNHWMLLFV